MTSVAVKKTKLAKKIDTYTKRREKYRKQSERLTKELKALKLQFKTACKAKDIAVNLRKAVMEFTGISIIRRGKKRNRDNNVFVARGLFFKYGTEKYKGKARFLMESIGLTTSAANDYRRSFTKSFQTNPKNKEIWMRFVEYMRHEENND